MQNIRGGNEVVKLGTDAFKGCYILADISGLDSVVEIGTQAFYGCSSLSCVGFIWTSITKIGGNAFYGCSGLNLNIELVKETCELDPTAFTNSGITYTWI